MISADAAEAMDAAAGAGSETAEAATDAAGGRLLQGKFPIANGYAAFVEDSEGNRIGLHSR